MQKSILHSHKVRFMSFKDKNELALVKIMVTIHSNSICNTQIVIYLISNIQI